MRKSKRGSIEYLSAFMVICLAGLLLDFSFSVKELRQYETDARDSLDSACLSAALIDMNRYPFSRFININNPENSWMIFKECLKNNMNLDSNFNSDGMSIYDKVTVHKFVIYNVMGNSLISYNISENGNIESESIPYSGSETTPDGSVIVSSTIYADIGMNVKSFLGIKKYVHVTTSVDVVNNL